LASFCKKESSSNQRQEANRANARHSTGPRTREGKQRSSLNAYKHGLTSPLLEGEDKVEFDRLRKGLLKDYNPQSKLGLELVEDVARTLLLKKRAAFFEVAILEARYNQVARADGLHKILSSFPGSGDEKQQTDKPSKEAKWRLQLGRALLRDASHGDLFSKVDRHRAMLTNDLIKTIKLLLVVEATFTTEGEEKLLIEETRTENNPVSCDPPG
jgi:hypothetical protein